MPVSVLKRLLTVGILVSGLPLLTATGADATAKQGQLCSKTAVNTQDGALTCAKDASGRYRWRSSTATTAATKAPTTKKTAVATVPVTTKAPATKKTAVTTLPVTTKAPATKKTAASTVPVTTKAARAVKTAKTTPVAAATATGSGTAKKGQFCKKTAIGQTETGAGGIKLTCTARATGGTPHWTQS